MRCLRDVVAGFVNKRLWEMDKKVGLDHGKEI